MFAAALLLARMGGAAAGEFEVLHQAKAHDAIFAIATEGQRAVGVGALGMAVASADGGATWTRQTTPTDLALLGVALDRGQALAVGQSGLILRREGDAWTRVDSGSTERLFGVALGADGTAVAVGAFGTLLRSEDAGRSWQPVKPDWETIMNDAIDPHLYAARIVNDTVLVAGESGLILRSRDRGRTWTAALTTDASLFDLTMDADGRGLAVGQKGTVVRTTDGGASWTTSTVGTDSALLGVWSSGSRVRIVGIQCAYVSADGGRTWTRDGRGDLDTAWYQTIGGDRRPIAGGHGGRIVALDN